MTRAIVVGADGSAAGTAAVEWAADDAARMQVPLRIICAVDRSPYHIAQFAEPALGDALNEDAEMVVANARAIALKRQSGIDVTTEVIQGAPAAVLCAQVSDAAEIVVGNRGLGGFARAVLGSVSLHVAGQAHGPVVVVRADSETHHGEIVVGIDDSPASEAALAYAFEQAPPRTSTLRAVHAQQQPVYGYAPVIAYDAQTLLQAQSRVVADRLQSWREKYPRVLVIDDVQVAHPVDALVAASNKADLVVVCSHGRGAFGSAVLGSVGHGVLHHAQCAVAVVRP
ncbi:universal stress protein [Planotetraspora sp. GP83]|uniref:universal stress protein n=1 Tax=Planotetraspora sp. GP83 TaxID=3156264 RepID=UPI003514ACD4